MQYNYTSFKKIRGQKTKIQIPKQSRPLASGRLKIQKSIIRGGEHGHSQTTCGQAKTHPEKAH